MNELDIETLKRLEAMDKWPLADMEWTMGQLPAIIAALEDRGALQKHYAEQTTDCSRLSERYEELLDKLEKYGYMEGIEAALEDCERLRDALDDLVNAWPIPSPQFTAALEKGRTALEGRDG